MSAPPRGPQSPQRRRLPAGVVAFAALAAAPLSCALYQPDPVHQSQVDALGPETPGIPPGPYHRAGQPCTVCHSDEGPASTVYVLAGTVFSSPATTSGQSIVGVDQASVGIVDDQGAEYLAVTNCVGNFFVTTDQFNPAFPILVDVSKEGSGLVSMTSHIGREGSCAACHADPPSTSTTGHVFLPSQAPSQNPSCPVSPVVTEP